MPATVTLDIDEQTMLQLGVENYDNTRAVRGYYATGMDTASSRAHLEEAILAVKTKLAAEVSGSQLSGTYHHPDDWDATPHVGVGLGPDLDVVINSRHPVQTITASPIGHDVVGTIEYGRTQFSPATYDAFAVCQEATLPAGKRTVISIKDPIVVDVGNSEMLPGGWGLYIDRTRISYNRTQITVRDVVDYHPKAFQLQGREVYHAQNQDNPGIKDSVNKFPVYINGLRRESKTNRFMDMNVEPFSTVDALKYKVEYTFLEDPFGFFSRPLYIKSVYCDNIQDASKKTKNCPAGIVGTSILIYKLGPASSGLREMDYANLFPVSSALAQVHMHVNSDYVKNKTDTWSEFVATGRGGRDTRYQDPTQNIASHMSVLQVDPDTL